MTLLPLLEKSSGCELLRCEGVDSTEETTLAELWELAGRVGSVLAARTRTGTVALQLEANIGAIAAVVGAWRAGLEVASLPLPAKSAVASDFVGWIDGIAARCGADLVVCRDESAVALRAEGARTPAVSFDTLRREASLVGDVGVLPGGRFIQYSSGSTGDPKGVRLSLDAMTANAESLKTALWHDRPTLVSWLPLSHDMGLMCLLTTWAHMAEVTPGAIHLLATELFTARPSRWLRTVSEQRATLTAGPTTAYRFAARRPPSGDIDLSSLRVALVGAEPVQASVLRAFEDAYAPHGLTPNALCPAYGLAEITVGASCSSPNERWRSTTVDASELGRGRWRPTDSDTRPAIESVSCGRPMPGVEVGIGGDGPGAVGRIQLRSDSLTSGYVTGEADLANGWLTTADLGFVDEVGEVHVLGRTDDIVLVAGRNVHPAPVEERMLEAGVARGNNAAVVADGAGGYAVVVEPDRRRLRTPDDLCREIRRAAVREVGAGPSRVVLVESRWFPRTQTGKIRRGVIRSALLDGSVPIRHEARFQFDG